MTARDRLPPVLCGTDFSATAIAAADVAAGLAGRLETALRLVHVENIHPMARMDPASLEAAVSNGRAELKREAARLREKGITVEEELRSGSAFDGLIDAAAEAGACLIVVGAVGHGLARRLLIGSVAERTAGTSSIPTLVVRPETRLGSWIDGKHPLKILAGYDFSAASDTALGWINDLQKIGPTDVHVLHIVWPPNETRRHDLEESSPLSKNPVEVQESLQRNLSDRVSEVLSSDNLTLTVEPGWGQTEAYLFEMAHLWGADLVVVGSHRRRGFDRLRLGSVSRAVLHHATVSVAVIPPPEERERTSRSEFDEGKTPGSQQSKGKSIGK